MKKVTLIQCPTCDKLVDLNYSNYGSLNDPKFLFDFTSISKIKKLKP